MTFVLCNQRQERGKEEILLQDFDPILSFSLKLVFLTSGGGAVDGAESGSGVRAAELGRGMRIFGAVGAIVDGGAGELCGSAGEGRDTG